MSLDREPGEISVKALSVCVSSEPTRERFSWVMATSSGSITIEVYPGCDIITPIRAIRTRDRCDLRTAKATLDSMR